MLLRALNSASAQTHAGSGSVRKLHPRLRAAAPLQIPPVLRLGSARGEQVVAARAAQPADGLCSHRPHSCPMRAHIAAPLVGLGVAPAPRPAQEGGEPGARQLEQQPRRPCKRLCFAPRVKQKLSGCPETDVFGAEEGTGRYY